MTGKRLGQVGATLASGFVLSACALVGPSSHTFTTAEQQKQPSPAAGQKQAAPDPKTLEQASQSCKESTREKGIKSVLAIVTRLRPGAVDEDYINCMRNKGYSVEK